MGVLLEQLAADDDAPADSTEQTADRLGEETDPFSMSYDFDDWELDPETTDHALSILIAVTNLL